MGPSVLLEARMARPCCGTSTKASTFIHLMVGTLSTPCASAPTAIGSVLPPAPASRSGTWRARSL
ncbi:receptor for activated C kinase 1 [Rhinolophus ferrumequinum]|uniref:Receptor for activated C kinase 1 n=1 Tax=Rhinolophus ferrumequinum TaxID=59479 RepID=A0A7J7RYM9_RHIFE|nr:receptor for activated C kinase 1 [Rhinolophus ferrumequinum]